MVVHRRQPQSRQGAALLAAIVFAELAFERWGPRYASSAPPCDSFSPPGPLKASRRNDSPPAPITKKSSAKFDFGIAVAHCEEDLSWLDNAENLTIPAGKQKNERLPATWDVRVYERCASEHIPERLRTFHKDYGDEECSAYLRYIIESYNSLPKIVYFLQPNTIVAKGDQEPNTHFKALQELIDASVPLFKGNKGSAGGPLSLDFLNLGNKDVWESVNVRRNVGDPVTEFDPAHILDWIKDKVPAYDNDTMTISRPNDNFAVRRESILRHPPDFYKNLFLEMLNYADEMQVCGALKQLWHIIFGQPYVLSDEIIGAIVPK